jgi:flagellar hook-length control protein FliK
MALPLMPMPLLQTPPSAMRAAPARRDAQRLNDAKPDRSALTSDLRERESQGFAQTLRDARKAADWGKPAEHADKPKPPTREKPEERSRFDDSGSRVEEASSKDSDSVAESAADIAGAAGGPHDGAATDAGAHAAASQSDQQIATGQSATPGAPAGSGTRGAGVLQVVATDGARLANDSTALQTSGAADGSETAAARIETAAGADSAGTAGSAGAGIVAESGGSHSSVTSTSLAVPALASGAQNSDSSAPLATATFVQGQATNAPSDQISGNPEAAPPRNAAAAAAADCAPATTSPSAASDHAEPVRPLDAIRLGTTPVPTPSPSGVDHDAGRHTTVTVLNDSGATSPAPAVARAAQVDITVRLENVGAPATGLDAQPMQLGLSGQASSHGASGNGFAQAGFGEAAGLFGRAGIAEDEAFTPQIVRGLHAMMNQRGGAMTLRLDPPELGELRVQMTIARGVVTAEFHASTPQAQTLLERNMAALRHSLESQGLTVERLSVHAGATQHGQQHAMANDDSGSSQQQSNASWSSQQDAAGSESRGRREQDAPAPQMREWEGEGFSFESLLGKDAGSPTLEVAGLAAERRGSATIGDFAR